MVPQAIRTSPENSSAFDDLIRQIQTMIAGKVTGPFFHQPIVESPNRNSHEIAIHQSVQFFARSYQIDLVVASWGVAVVSYFEIRKCISKLNILFNRLSGHMKRD